ncbi:hypothetical protein PIB30_068178 [Stylosanthes scabra]|uniref:Uncharacterized protein n=1 Tax=Stylosanthes scabra TaxID=79078 RepID=A0ABU6QMT9_9FABA|nr:hypothetical protein [Stylosanthes scabra]
MLSNSKTLYSAARLMLSFFTPYAPPLRSKTCVRPMESVKMTSTVEMSGTGSGACNISIFRRGITTKGNDNNLLSLFCTNMIRHSKDSDPMMVVAKLRKDRNSKRHDYENVDPMNPRVNPVLKHDHYGWGSSRDGVPIPR